MRGDAHQDSSEARVVTARCRAERLAAANEAYEMRGEKLPAPFAERLKRWLATIAKTRLWAAGRHVAVARAWWHGWRGDAWALHALLAAELNTTAAAIQDEFDELSISAHTRDKALGAPPGRPGGGLW